MAALDAKL